MMMNHILNFVPSVVSMPKGFLPSRITFSRSGLMRMSSESVRVARHTGPTGQAP